MVKQKKFKKVVEYYYPNGDKYNGTLIGFYLGSFFALLIYVISSPIHYFLDDYCGGRKVYWKEIKCKNINK